MVRQRVVSSSVTMIGYSAASEVLEIEFVNGRTYQYFKVPAAEHRALMASSSKGQHVVHFIKSHYVCAMVAGVQQ